MITTKRMLPDEIAQLRQALKLSEGEFASRIGLFERRSVKLMESGAQKPSDKVSKLMMKLLQRSAGRSPKLKKLLETIKGRVSEV